MTTNHRFAVMLVASAAAQSFVHGTGEAVGQPPLVGVGSCTSAGCHGAGHPTNVVGSEYNIWVSQDPHARAYSVLFDERSLRMVRLLKKLPADASVAAHEEPQCLACHSQTTDPHSPFVSDGVGCESCHGPAGDWLADHFRVRLGKVPLTADERQSSGMWDTDRLLVRTQVCVGCHVGGDGRNVNHDLIAAGHPRLLFEMSAYLAAMPKHWTPSRDDAQAKFGPNFDAAVWAIGQAVASHASLHQLAERAESGKTWPEFAEWTCSACHHDLRDDAARQQQLAAAGGLSGRVMAWDTWNHQTVEYHAADISRALGLDEEATAGINADLRGLGRQMGTLNPNRQQVATAARDAAARVERWAAMIENGRFSRPALDRLTQAIVTRPIDSGVTDWSSAAQVYDALANLHQARLEVAPADNAELTVAIRKLYDELAAKQQAPGEYVFRPEELRMKLIEVRKQLPALEGEP